MQATYHDGQMVAGMNCPEIVHKYDLQYNDTVDFKIHAFILKLTIYKFDDSTARCTPALNMSSGVRQYLSMLVDM
jgi:hypothetical protein